GQGRGHQLHAPPRRRVRTLRRHGQHAGARPDAAREPEERRGSHRHEGHRAADPRRPSRHRRGRRVRVRLPRVRRSQLDERPDHRAQRRVGHVVRFGIKLMPQHCTWDELLTLWREADEHELFESAWTFDHFYPIYGDWQGPCLEAWVTLGALAQATSRIRIGCLVNGVVYRHPAVLANMAAALDSVSGGRLELGLGAGWNERECDAYGIELGTLTERFDRFEEACEVITRLLRDERTDFDGRYYTLTDARCEPKSVQRPHPPVCIGGAG